MYPMVRTSLVIHIARFASLVKSCVAFIGIGVYPEISSSLRRLTLMKGHVLTLGLGQVLHRDGCSMSGLSVCINAYSILLVRQLKYVRFIGMDICILQGRRNRTDHWKYVRFIGMNVCLAVLGREAEDQSMSGSSVSVSVGDSREYLRTIVS